MTKSFIIYSKTFKHTEQLPQREKLSNIKFSSPPIPPSIPKMKFTLLTAIFTCALAAYAAPARDAANPPEADRKPFDVDLTELQVSAPLNGSGLVARDSYMKCNYLWMGTGPFCNGQCSDVPGVYESAPEEIVRLDHTLPCPTNGNWGDYRINNKAACDASGHERTSCWTGKKAFCRYNCVGVFT